SSPNMTTDFLGASIDLHKNPGLNSIGYEVLVQDVVWELAQRSSEVFTYPSSLEWSYELTGSFTTKLDSSYSSLTKFLSNDISVTPGSGSRTITNSIERIHFKISLKVGDDLSILSDNRLDSLRFNLVFKNSSHENISFANPEPIQGGVWMESDTIAFFKTARDLKENDIVELEFLLTVISTGNYSDENLLSNEENIVVQSQGTLLQDIYSSAGFENVYYYQTGLPSDLQKRAFAALTYQTYLNFIIKIPLTFSYSG
ncbi:MAG: hypothetical protein ACXQS8_00110, partial [Candidatus Helarchaeales archaeon]